MVIKDYQQQYVSPIVTITLSLQQTLIYECTQKQKSDCKLPINEII